jgi:hypothetical protein
MRRSRIQLYAPFLALVLLQGMIMLLAPAVGGDGQLAADEAAGTEPGGIAAPGSGRPDAAATAHPVDTDPSGPEVPVASGDEGDATGGQAGAGVSEAAAAEDDDGNDAGTGTQGATQAQGDTSHCTDDGRQHGFFYHAPPCEPASDGTNPGATYRGVTDDEILVVVMTNVGHPLLDAIFESEVTPQDQDDFRDAAADFISTHYELHGRQVRIETYRSQCPLTPPDPATCREEARRVIGMEPFMVYWGVGGLYPTIYDEFVRAGIIALGAANLHDAFYNERRPFRWAEGMDGTQLRTHVGEYYCTKLAGGMAERTGEVIHERIGNRGEVPRRFGIGIPDTPSMVANANALAEIIEECDGYRPPIFTYELNIERGLEQATAVVAGMISEGVTTVTCMCDPVAPQFFLDEASSQDYHPELLLTGINLIDADPVGRIYDQDQWERAFGPSGMIEPQPRGETAADAVWEGAGRDGDCVVCRESPVTVESYLMIGHLLQAGGADLDPGSVERGAFEYGARGGWEETGDPRVGLREFGPNNYTWGQDMREVYWDPNATSVFDGEQGAYVAVDGGRRYQLGEWTSDLDVPMP